MTREIKEIRGIRGIIQEKKTQTQKQKLDKPRLYGLDILPLLIQARLAMAVQNTFFPQAPPLWFYFRSSTSGQDMAQFWNKGRLNTVISIASKSTAVYQIQYVYIIKISQICWFTCLLITTTTLIIISVSFVFYWWFAQSLRSGHCSLLCFRMLFTVNKEVAKH